MRPTNKAVYLYHILDSRYRVRYVGISSAGERRLKSHISVALTGRFVPTPFIAWLKGQLSKNRVPRIRVIRQAKADCAADERAEIIRLRRKGHPLLNVVVKGDNYHNRRRWDCKCGRVIAKSKCVCGRNRPQLAEAK